jgi:4-amino-4-deoxy-L-arabinose transferase-like glycosyltransferase
MTHPSRNSFWRPSPLDRWDWPIGAIVLFGAFLVLMSTLDMGFTRDESFYFHAAYEYIEWFEELWKNWNANTLADSFTQANVDKHWGYNREHPVLVKTLFALSWKLFHDKLEWLSHSEALRLPGAAFGAMTVLFTYLFGRQTFGRLAGVIAAGALFFQPRFFFHAHLTCFDVPVTALWLMVIYAYWRSYDSKAWALATGVLWGLALSAKLNAFFLPPVLLMHWFVVHWREFGIERDDFGLKIKVPPVPWAFVAMAIIGPILFYALWPRHWFDTWNRVQWYLNFHLKHVHYFVWYFGEILVKPPFPVSYPWIMTAVTVPATLLLASVMGLFAAARQWRLVDWITRWVDWVSRWMGALRRKRLPDTRSADAGFDPRGTALLLAINFLFPIVLIGMPETPIFGGTKHWMPAMPFLAMLAGAGVALTCTKTAEALAEFKNPANATIAKGTICALLSLAVIGPAAYATWYNHPFGTSYYNELIGSYRGAADAQMMRQFWGYAGRQGMPWVNENAPKGARVHTHNTTGYAWAVYRRDDMARKDLRTSGRRASDYSLHHHQQAFAWGLTHLWDYYGTRAPAHVVSIDGVPVLSVYERPGTRDEAANKGKKGKKGKKNEKKGKKE